MGVQKIIIGTLSGLVAGVAIGLLIAPDKGSETRQRIADTAKDWKKKLQNLRGATSEEFEELKSIFEKEVGGLRDDVRVRVLQLIKASKASGNHWKEKVLS